MRSTNTKSPARTATVILGATALLGGCSVAVPSDASAKVDGADRMAQSNAQSGSITSNAADVADPLYDKLEAGESAVASGEYVKAEQILRRLEGYGGTPRLWALGRALAGQGKFKEAVVAYRESEAFGGLYSNWAERIMEQVTVARRADDRTELKRLSAKLVANIRKDAVHDKEAVGLADLTGPRASEAMLLAIGARQLFSCGEFRASVAMSRRAIKLRPDYAGARFRLARALSFAGDSQGAVREMALASKGNNPEVRAAAQRAIAVGVNGIPPQSTLTPAHRKQLDAMRRAGKTGPLVP